MSSEKLMDHFVTPCNIGVIDDARVVVRAGDAGRGDNLLISGKYSGRQDFCSA